MKPKDILPDHINEVTKDGVTIRKGTIGAFTENIKIIESLNEGDNTYKNAVTDLLSLIPALKQLSFFEYYSIKSEKVRELLKIPHPELMLD
jgi:hypothetical protein